VIPALAAPLSAISIAPISKGGLFTVADQCIVQSVLERAEPRLVVPRRVTEVARLLVDAGLVVIVSFISPYRAEREIAWSRFAPGEFLEVFVDTPLEVCERRDPKGLYAKARRGELINFTGIDSSYQPPEAPDPPGHGDRERRGVCRSDSVRLGLEFALQKIEPVP
jgi:hypothetical protein